MPQDRQQPRVYKTILAEFDLLCFSNNLQLQLRTEVFSEEQLGKCRLEIYFNSATVKLHFKS